MREPFHLVKTELWYDDRWVGSTHGLSFASGDPVAAHADLDKDMTGVALAPLPGADILFVARDQVFGVERKTWSDLNSSRWNGHLTEQLNRMLESFDVTILCIEADWERVVDKPDFDNQMPDTLQTMLLDWQDLGVRIVQTNNARHTATYIRKLYKKYATRTASEPLRQPKLQPGLSIETQMLMRIPGIGVRTSDTLLKQHGDLENLLLNYKRWTLQNLATYDGKAVSQKILKALPNLRR